MIAIFYCLVFPVGNTLSIDSIRRASIDKKSVSATVAMTILQIHLCIMYGTAGVSKIAGEQWWSGDALWRALSEPMFAQVDLTWLSTMPGILAVAGIGALSIQLLFPVAIFYPRLRGPWVILIEINHLLIAVFLGLWLFSAMMIVLNMAAFGTSVLRFGRESVSFITRQLLTHDRNI